MTNIEPIHLISYLRQRCEDDFSFFVRYFFKHQKGSRFKFNWHHEEICTALMRVFKGEDTFLIVNMPPRYSKTELIVKMFSAWCFVKNPRSEFIHLSYSDPLALDNSEAIKSILKSSEFMQLWPEITIQQNKDSKKAWSTSGNGSFYATAAGGSVTGFGAGRVDEGDDGFTFSGAIIIDDPLKPDDAHSNPKRTAINRRWDETIKSRRNSNKTPVIVVMQRLHEDDFCGTLLSDTEFDWKVLELPAIVDEGKSTERALWPDKHSIDDLRLMKSKNSYQFAGQMQQRPSPLGGGIIKGAWFGRYSVLPKIKWRACFGDTAQKAKESNDYQVAQCYGLGEDGCLYLIDVLRDKFEGYELEKRFPDFWIKQKASDNGRLRYFGIEDKSSGTDLIQKMQKVIKPKIPVKAIQRSTDKVSRVMDVQGYIEAGYVKIPDDAPWVSDFISECEAFTKNDTHAYDDQIDPLCDAISEMLHGNKTSLRDAL